MKFEKQYNRILIIGAPGVGKTTLAKKLGEIYSDLPVVHLDNIHYLENFVLRDTKERDKMINKEADKQKWIIDGTFIDTIDKRLKRADLIIFLDYSKWTALRGIVLRRMVVGKKKIPSLNRSFVKYVFNYNKEYRPILMEKLDKINPKKVMKFKSRHELNKAIKQINND